MSDSEQNADAHWDSTIFDLVLTYAERRYVALARRVIARLQRIEATGVYGDDFGHKTLWDEYCHEVQEGPYELLQLAWLSTVDPLLDAVVAEVPAEEAALLTIAADHYDFPRDASQFAPGPDLIREHLRGEIRQLAEDRDISRFRPS